MDLFKKILDKNISITELLRSLDGVMIFPKLSGGISNHVSYKGASRICWSYNNYLGLAGSEKVKSIDSFAQTKWGMTYPMGSRAMTGDTVLHEEFEREFSSFLKTEKSFLLNMGYQGLSSCIDALLSSDDVVISDAQCHACSIDGIRMSGASKLIYKHNDIADLENMLVLAEKMVKSSNGGILLITEGVFSMSGAQGKLQGICELKKKYNFRLLVDDAHGFGVMGPSGRGTIHAQNCEKEVDLYFTTFTKSMASFGAVITGNPEIVEYLRYNVRSQIFSKSLPMPIVYGLIKRLEILKNADAEREQLFVVTNSLQNKLKKRNLLSPQVASCITPVSFSIDLNEILKIRMELIINFNVFCSIITYPAVPKGQVIFRLTSSSEHTLEDVDQTVEAFDHVFKKYIS